jgi:hypothetical protein
VIKRIEEELALKLRQWGAEQAGISCILQMDIDYDETSVSTRNRYLKFMIVTQSAEQLMSEAVWLENFGCYSKCHKANHGFFQIIKATYESGITINFVLIEGEDKNDAYKFCEIEDLEKSVKILLCKN